MRTFRTTDGEETWDFGDGSAPVTVKSDGNVNPLAPQGYAKTVHRYKKAGQWQRRKSFEIRGRSLASRLV
ncbi:MAG: hypothetical protein ACREEM_22235 [Blastocatellia bacterium]